MAPQENKLVARRDLPLLLLLLAALAARHLCAYHQGVDVAHLGQVLERLCRISAGEWLVEGPEFWVLQTGITGSLFFWLHLPLLWFDEVITGLHLLYLCYEAAGLAAFVLLGLRGGLDRRLVWIAAALLALYWDQGAQLAENTVLAHYLAPPLLMALLTALGRGRSPAAMLLPGVLLALAGQIHPLALTALPALLLSPLLTPGGRARRLAWLLAGLVAGYLPALPGMVLPGHGAAGELVAGVFDWDPGRLPEHLAHLPLDPAALLGLLLVVVLAIRRRAPGLPAALAALWLVTVLPLLLFAVAHLDHTFVNEYRYALLKPARALLSATLVCWLADTLRPRFAARLQRRRGLVPPALAWAGAAACLLALKAPCLPPCAFDLAGLDAGQPRACRMVQLHRMSFVLGPMERGLSRITSAAPGRHRFWGAWPEPLNTLLWWRELSDHLPDTPLKPGPGRAPLLVMPPSAELERLGAVTLGDASAAVAVLPGEGFLSLDEVEAGRVYTGRLPPGSPGPRLLGLLAYSRHGAPLRFRLTLRQGGRAVPPLAEAPCVMERPLGLALFQLVGEGGTVRVEVSPGEGQRPRRVEAILLRPPSSAGAPRRGPASPGRQ